MSLYRIAQNSFPSTKFLLWISLTEISQHDIIWVPHILGVTQDETMAVDVSQHQFSICQAANGQFCHIYTPLQPPANPPSCTTALYAKNATSISNRCLLQIRKTQSISLPSQFTPNIWILTSAPSTVTTAITLICPGETTKFITVKKLIHILWLPPACSITSPHFHLSLCYEHSALTVNVSLNMVNLNMVNLSSLDFHIWQHLKDHGNETQLHHLFSIPSVPIAQLYKHMISGIKPITPFTSPEESTGDTVSIWTLFSHTGVYRIGDILLLFLLVLTCQISMPTFTTRFYMIYYCRWWCRGSTHLQMQWQGQTAHKTSWESWPDMEEVPTWTESWQNQQKQSLVVLHVDHWNPLPNSREHRNVHNIYIVIDGNTPNDLKKQKIFHFTDKLLLHNMAASSGLRENVYPINFLLKMFIFMTLLLLLLIGINVKSQWLMLLFSGTDVKTCLDVVSLFYYIPIVVPFSDILVTPKVDGTFTTKVYRKPTHTDQYLQWDSNHNLASKYSVIKTLTHRARTLCSTPELNNELEHLEEVLKCCKYPRWTIRRSSINNINRIRPIRRGIMSHQLRRDAILWFHILRVSVRALRTFARDMEYRYILKEEQPLRTY